MKQITEHTPYHMPAPTCFGSKVPLSGNLSTAKVVGPTRISGADHHHCNLKVNISASTCLHCPNNNTTQRWVSLVTHSQPFIHPGLCTQTSVSIYMLIGTFFLKWGWGIPRKSLWHRFWDTLYVWKLKVHSHSGRVDTYVRDDTLSVIQTTDTRSCLLPPSSR
jgi:hypothetical protein